MILQVEDWLISNNNTAGKTSAVIRSGVGGCGIDSLDQTPNPPENEQKSPGKGAMFKGNFIFINFQGDMLVSGRVIVEKVKV